MVAYEADVQSFLTKSQLLLEAFPDARISTKYKKLGEDKAFVTAKTEHSTSHAVVKFKTDKTVDLGRLMVGCNKLSATLANKNLEETPKQVTEDVEMHDQESKAVPEQPVTSNTNEAAKTTSSKKKKKKGKK